MSVSSKAPRFLHYWPIIATVAALGFVAAKHVSSEPVRAVISLSCIGLMVYQWTILRRKQRFSLPGLVLLTLVMVSGWLGLNVIRNYTYPRGSLRQMLPVYDVVVHVQALLMWPILCAVLVITLWAIIRLSRWLAGRVS